MADEKNIRDVGAPIATEQNSPIVDELKEDGADKTVDNAVCWFNSVQFREGEEVYSEGAVLKCHSSGKWVKQKKDK